MMLNGAASNKYFGSTPFTDLLAPSIADDTTIHRAAESIDAPIKASAKSISNVLIFARLAHDSGFSRPVSMLAPLERLAALTDGLASLPETVLDLLAWQLHVEGYAEAVSLKAKREMIWASVILHRKKGTPWAVKHGLETTLQVPATISEWFEYGGEPYFFRVELDVSGVAIDARALENAVKVIFAHKNVRSWLEFLRTKSVRKLPVFIASGEVNYTKTLAFTWRWPLIFDGFSSFYGAIPDGRTCVAIAFKNAPAPETGLKPHIALCAAGFSRSFVMPGFSGKTARASLACASTLYSLTRSNVCPKQN